MRGGHRKKTLVTREQLTTALQRQHGIGKSAGAVFCAMASLARFAHTLIKCRAIVVLMNKIKRGA
jgi:hypothetical protein